MKVTNREIYNAQRPLGELVGKDIPIKIAYQVIQLADVFDKEIKKLEVLRKQLVTRYGEADPKNPTAYWVPPNSEKYPKFAEEIEELMDIEIDLDIQPVKLPGTLEISPLSLRALKRFIRV